MILISNFMIYLFIKYALQLEKSTYLNCFAHHCRENLMQCDA